MGNDIEVVAAGDGFVLIGNASDLDRFVEVEGLQARTLDQNRLSCVLGAGGAVAQAGAVIAENSGRWVKLTEESARAVRASGLRTSATSGNATGVIAGSQGRVKGFVEFSKTPAATFTNPAALAGIGAMATQMAMQQAMDEITDYLAAIDAKVDDVLRAQKDEALSAVIGAGVVIDEALTVRDAVGRVSDITWSKVDQTPQVVARAQAYALRRLDAVVSAVERSDGVRDRAKQMTHARAEAGDWLAVLARCAQLQDAIDVLELDRVLDSAPDEIDDHRQGLAAVRARRTADVSRATADLLERLRSVMDEGNDAVLAHPWRSPALVNDGNALTSAVGDFRRGVGLDGDAATVEARRWQQAVVEKGSDARSAAAEAADAVQGVAQGAARGAADKVGSAGRAIAGTAARLWSRG